MKHKAKDAVVGYLYILPSLVLILTFSIIPIFMSLYFSFTKYNVIQPAVFVGFNNYIRMLKDPFVKASLSNTIAYTLIVVPVQTLLSLAIAAVIADKFRNRLGEFFKSALFVPVISSAILVGTIWSFLLATDNGIINAVLGLLRIPKINWLGQISSAFASVCIVSIWKNVGYFLVIFYAGIMDIPRTMYEAGDVDGATKLQQFSYITLPYLIPITFLVVTLGTIWSFQVFDLVYAMTGGGPGKATVTLVLTIYNTAFKEYSMGYASSIAFLLFAIIIIISAIQKFLFKERY